MCSADKNHPSLGFGQFYGRVLRSRETHGIAAREIADLPPDGIPRHTHEHNHFCLVINGDYQTRARNVDGQCRPMTLIFHPAGTTHEDRFLASGGRCLMISLGAKVLPAYGEPVLGEHSIALDDSSIGFPGCRLHRELLEPGELSEVVLEGIVLEMIGHALRRRAPSERTHPGWLNRATDFIRERATEPKRVSEVAEAAGVHPVHLARVFQRFLGVSPGEYLRRERVRAAMVGLENSDRTLARIAVDSGFCDQSELTKAFRRELGTTPGAFRRILRS